MSSLLAEIRWSVCMSKSHRSLCVSLSRTDAGLFVWSNLNFLHNSQWITLPTQSYLVLYSFCAPSVLILSGFGCSIPSLRCRLPLFITCMAHFSMPSSIPMDWLYILIACIRVSSSFHFLQIIWCHPCTLGDWSFPAITKFVSGCAFSEYVVNYYYYYYSVSCTFSPYFSR